MIARTWASGRRPGAHVAARLTIIGMVKCFGWLENSRYGIFKTLRHPSPVVSRNI